MGQFDEFDQMCDENPDIEPSQLFAEWLSGKTGEVVIGREVDGDNLVISIPEAL